MRYLDSCCVHLCCGGGCGQCDGGGMGGGELLNGDGRFGGGEQGCGGGELSCVGVLVSDDGLSCDDELSYDDVPGNGDDV